MLGGDFMRFNFKRLKAERIAKGLTLAEMGDAIEVSESGYKRIEDGERKLGVDQFAKLVERLGFDQDRIHIFFYSIT